MTGAGAAVLVACGGGGDDTAGTGSGETSTSAPADDSSSPAATESADDGGGGGGGGGLVATADVPVKGGVVLDGKKIVVTQPTAGEFKAFTAVCTHHAVHRVERQGQHHHRARATAARTAQPTAR